MKLPKFKNGEVFDFVVVGAGFGGIAAALELATAGETVLLLEASDSPGGLAGTFNFGGDVEVERFYHHWFRNDLHMVEFLEKYGLAAEISWKNTNTASYINKQHWRLSSPIDLLRFRELSMLERIRLGLAVVAVRLSSNFEQIESKSIEEWLSPIVGRRVFNIVWKPLIDSKFGEFSHEVSAAWMWKKLRLRGSSRSSGGNESLGYFRGGFGRLARLLVRKIEEGGGEILYGEEVLALRSAPDDITILETSTKSIAAKAVILAIPEPEARKILGEARFPKDFDGERAEVPHLANICLVMKLSKSLSDTYWLNVHDGSFPFVGVVEHTNLDDSQNYGGSHVVYLSRYLSRSDPAWDFSDALYFKYCLPFLEEMFPDFEESWILDWRIWRAAYAQPVVTRNYSKAVPPTGTLYPRVFVTNMAQIYPEDRGTNYAIFEGVAVAAQAAAQPL